MDGIHVTKHALDRYQIHFAGSRIQDVVTDVQQGETVPSALAQTITGRKVCKTTNRYVLSTKLKGMFVLDGEDVVTYLRFGGKQQAFVQKHYTQAEAGSEPEAPEPDLNRKDRLKQQNTEFHQRSQERFYCSPAAITMADEIAAVAGSKTAIRKWLVDANLLGADGLSFIYAYEDESVWMEVVISAEQIPHIQSLIFV